MGSAIKACTRCGVRRTTHRRVGEWCRDCLWVERHRDESEPYTGSWRVRHGVLMPVEVAS